MVRSSTTAQIRKVQRASAKQIKAETSSLPESPVISLNDDDALSVANRIISAYGGISALKEFATMLESQVPGPQIAQKFGVSRQRINQWTHAIGSHTKTFALRECVAMLIKDLKDESGKNGQSPKSQS